MVEVKVAGIALDDRSKTPIVILQEKSGTRVLPIWIGPNEASSIAMELAGKKFQRPLTHDLMKTMIEGLCATVSRVVITELRDNTFYAKIVVMRQNEILSIDARPSDSIALAVRSKSPIFVAPELLGPDQGHDQPQSDEERAEALKKHLRDMNPEDFGKFSM
ncbi:MAG: bifunctional nuclease family protein [bacterium]